ncbi:MAG: phage tail protein [Anaeromusa sp.]|uniref:phage tail protein n=1 Tax=Anaeromusa sp. TaxID=1872520 RepID=UPI002B1F7FC8|nr:phage tail protein [Anaeromusa sp.]MEA4835375.1 phage tail protein [Anaeromusa sp.]
MAGLFGSGKSVVNEQERISEFQVNQATYGEVVPIVFGTTRISGNIIDYFNFTAVRHEESQSAGKGGKTTTTNVAYTYKAAVLVGLGEGPIDGIGRVWKDTDTVTDLTGVNLSLFNGAYGQLPWSYTQSVAPDRALPYSGLAYAAGYIDLNSSAGVPTFNFELMGLLRSSGDGTDCNPADVIAYIMSDRYNGMGMSASDIDAASLQVLRTYCAAADLLISLPATDKTPGYEIANTLCEALNCIVFCGQDGLKIIPRCDEAVTGNGVTYTPDLTPLYDLDEDDFIADDDGRHVRFERTDNADTYNQCQVEFINRSNSYETEKTDYQVASNVNRRGLRPMTRTYHFFHTKSRAAHVAQIQATKSCFNRLTHLFRLGESHCLLEPGDLVTLTTKYGPDKLDRVLVRIETFKELQDEEGYDVTATPVISGTYSPAKYATYEADRAYIDYNTSPGSINSPAIIEPPAALVTSGSGLELWVGASANDNFWGGCSVWVSDTGDSYIKVGVIKSRAKQGVLREALGITSDPFYGDNVINLKGGDAFSTADENADDVIVLHGGTASTAFVNAYCAGNAQSSSGENYTCGNAFVTTEGDIYDCGSVVAPVGDTYCCGDVGGGLEVALKVDMSKSLSKLESTTRSGADNFNTLCYVGGEEAEWISYERASLSGSYQYDIAYLRRGLYGSPITKHNATSNFLRIDKDAFFKYDFTADRIGKTYYLKFTSFNVFGTGEQDLSDVQVYQYKVVGRALYYALPDIANLQVTYKDGNAVMVWSPVNDPRTPVVYEIRKGGSSWATAQYVCRILETSYQPADNDIYWVSAAYNDIYATPSKYIYSDAPANVDITGARIAKNVVVVYDEAASYWPGALSGGAAVQNNVLTLGGEGYISTIPEIESVDSLIMWGGTPSMSGTYTLPDSHVIDLETAQLCNIGVSYKAAAQNVHETFDSIVDVDQLSAWDGNYLQSITVQPQINIADKNGVWSGWQDYIAGQYFGRRFNARLIYSTSDVNITPIISSLKITIDMPDKLDTGSVALGMNGSVITYNEKFVIAPNPVITIVNAQAGDTILLSEQSKAGFLVRVYNTVSTEFVSRTINWVAKGY